ncbi:MAG: TIGR03790 family protein [Lentimonas sp.]
MIFRKQFTFLCGLLLLQVTAYADSLEETERVVIVVNSKDPSSLVIGEYYAEKRGIPKANIIHLSTSTQETITVREYVDTIYNPLLTELIAMDRVKGVRNSEPDKFGRVGMSVAVNTVSYLVTIRGIPLRIANDPTLVEANLKEKLPKEYQVNQSAVDSDLALLLAPSHVSMTALIPSPLFNQKRPSATDLSRVLRVSRLDGPDVLSVKKLVDRTLEAEATGLMGRAYFDIGGPHATGDEWFNAALDYTQAAYFDTDFETTKKRIGMNSRLDGPAIYMGWYTQNAYGPWAELRWPVPPGAIGFHLHSFSATSMRDVKKGWLAAFVKQGYSVTMGNVYEPYLQQTHRPQHLLELLFQGHTFGEAVTYSNPALSWMGVAIGDPLYRPFKVDLREQLQQEPDGPFSTYAYIREVNRLLSEVSSEAALKYARIRFIESPTLAMAYKLSTLYLEQGQAKEAAEALKIIRYITVFSSDEQILVKKIADQLHRFGESSLALEIYERLINQRNMKKALRIALLRGGAPIAESLGNSTQSAGWILEARQLAAPPAPKQPVGKK